MYFFFFFFSSRRRHTRFDCDWSSDVCSSDLEHERVRAESLGDEAADRVEPEVGQEQRARRPLEPRAEEADEEDEDQKVPQRLVEKGWVEKLFLGVLGRP